MKKGFTLIELLAVIVILAIIALIATPIILGIINDTKVESNERSAEMYIDAVEQAIAKENFKREFNPSVCNIQETGDLLCDGETAPEKEIIVSVDGTKPDSGVLIFRNNKIDTSEIVFSNTSVITENDGTTTQKQSTTPKTYNNGDPVYFNVTTGEKCDSNEAVSTIGTKSGCMKFYAFNDTEDSYTVKLLLDHNTTSSVAWTNSTTNTSVNGPINVINQLKAHTESWRGTITPENYSINQGKDKANYTVDYSEYKARLITAQEVAQIVGNTTFNESTPSNYISIGSEYGWLYDRTSTDCTTYGCLNNSDDTTNGYWTISPWTQTNVYYVVFNGSMGDSRPYQYVVNYSAFGVRPVIEVLKSKLS